MLAADIALRKSAYFRWSTGGRRALLLVRSAPQLRVGDAVNRDAKNDHAEEGDEHGGGQRDSACEECAKDCNAEVAKQPPHTAGLGRQQPCSDSALLTQCPKMTELSL